MKIKRILVCTDGSPPSDEAVGLAINLARSLAASLTVFHAIEDYPYSDNLAQYAIATGLVTPSMWAAHQHKRAKRILDLAVAKAKKAGIECRGRQLADINPHRAILEAARLTRSQLIVMASHGMEKLLLGSETNRVLAHSRIPVLVCR